MQADLEEQFVQQWESASTPPDVFEFLSVHNCQNKETILALIEIDQDFRVATQQTLPIDYYVERLPTLVGNQETSVEFALRELSKRKSAGETIDVDQFISEFGTIAHSLRVALRQFGADSGDEDNDGQLERSQPGEALHRTATHINTEFVREEWIGRYRLIKILGRGAFGQVYLAVDSELQRQVAIKIPAPERFHGSADVDQYLAEARMVARLDHSHVVSVFDVGKTDEGLCYVVSQFIQGATVREAIAGGVRDYARIVNWLSSIAAALQHAHERGIIHRDVKPANILIQDLDDKAFLADFGLAIRNDDYLAVVTTAGTPAYMSPEQARGEGHRLDGRSDIFSLGVVMYELLSGKRPFRGSSAEELMYEITSSTPVPPSQVRSDIPAELERICLKMLSKQCSERYASAQDVVDDLKSWDEVPRQDRQAAIVPRGLRPFRSDDADFFLGLLPGPYDRNGLPTSIRFWKDGIENRDPEHCFQVGMLFGPSGCGKSSLLRAGLLPKLEGKIRSYYVEATGGETETRILRKLRKDIPDLPESASVVDAFAHLRKHDHGYKSLIVIDQLEQWLQIHQPHPDHPLVRGLRQADGANVQVLLSVRDDFGMAAARLMKAIDSPIVEGENFATVDLFPREHAKQVFTRLGQAYGCLPQQHERMEASQHEFVERVIDGLAHDERVVCVQLALFSEMVKSKRWTSETLAEVGGTEGIGVNFLEEALGARVSNPARKIHVAAAQRMLRCLLPAAGSDIKGHMRSRDELMQAAGYGQQPKEFRDLLRLLDGELRLITPTEPEGVDSLAGSAGDSQYYQLTHDYLVKPLRTWLTASQMQTRRGRVALRMADRASLWKAHPEPRYLPTLMEYLSFLVLGSRGKNDSATDDMMHHATRYYGLASCVACVVLLLVGLGGWRWLSRNYAESLIENGLMTASIEDYPQLLEKIAPVSSMLHPRLERLYEEDQNPFIKLKAALALVSTGHQPQRYTPEVQSWMLDAASPNDLSIPLEILLSRDEVSDSLGDALESMADGCWNCVNDGVSPEDRQLKAACILSRLNTEKRAWKQVGPDLAHGLVSQSPSEVHEWAELLLPIRERLYAPMSQLATAATTSPLQRQLSVQVMANVLAKDQPQVLIDMVRSADVNQFEELAQALFKIPESVELVRQQLDALMNEEMHANPESAQVAEFCKLAVLMAKLDIAQFPWQLLSLERGAHTRSRMIHEMSELKVQPTELIEHYAIEDRSDIRSSILLILGALEPIAVESTKLAAFRVALQRDFASSPDPGLHSAIAWLTAMWAGEVGDLILPAQQADQVMLPVEPSENALLAKTTPTGWFVNDAGMTLTYFKVKDGEESSVSESSVPRWVAIGTREITRQQWLQYSTAMPDVVPGDHPQLDERLPEMSCPMAGITWCDAAGYCNWLSQVEGIPERDWCYAPNDEGKYEPGMVIKPDFLNLRGYRLPTVREWTTACEAGTASPYSFGSDESLLPEYAWFSANSNGHAWSVGLLKPNAWGLFDVHGNIIEWCQDRNEALGSFSRVEEEKIIAEQRREMRGGAYSNPARETTVLHASNTIVVTRNTAVGLRIARTLAVSE